MQFRSAFFADGGWASVEDGIDTAVEVGEDVSRCRRAGVAKEVCTGGRDGQSNGSQQGVRGGVRGNADTNKFPASGDRVWNGRAARKQQGEGPRARRLW